jgi:hypothetical protein
MVSGTVVLSDPAPREGEWFLRRDIRDCSLASSSSSSRLVYLFIGRASRVVAFNANSVRPIVVFI